MSSEPTEIDGRRARRGRNRESVVTAMLEMFREGDMNPSVARVAERSGVSLRSVFRYFDDLDEMARIAIEQHADSVQHLFLLNKIGEGTRPDRIRRLVDQRITLYQDIAPVARAARLRAVVQPVVNAALGIRDEYLRVQTVQHFATELAPLSDTERFVVSTAIDTMTSIDTIEGLVVNRRLSVAKAGAVMRGSVDRLLP